MNEKRKIRITHLCKFALMDRIEFSARSIFSNFADIELPPASRNTALPRLFDSKQLITATIKFDGIYKGLLALHCPEKLALQLASGLLGFQPEEAEQEVHNVLKEAISIMGGDIKLFLASTGKEIDLSAPNVCFENIQKEAQIPNETESINCTFGTGEQKITIGVMLQHNFA
jgi:CheY-specific phosphatase CheX